MALGIIETKGLLGSIVAADAMAKAANVDIVEKEITGGALLIVKIVGDVASVKEAIAVGARAAAEVGELAGKLVIANPDNQISPLIKNTKKHKKSMGHKKDKEKEISSDIDGSKIDDLSKLSVPELRKIARSISNFPLTGKEISSSKKDTLIELLKKLL